MNDSVVNALCIQVFGAAPDSVRRAETGMVNTVYILNAGGERYVLRMSKEKGAYAESRRILREAAHLGLPVPEVIACGASGEYEYMFISFIEGEDLGLVYPKLTNSEKRLIAEQTAEIQRKAAGLICVTKPEPWYGFAEEMLVRAEERMRQSGYFGPEKASRIMQEAVYLKSYFESLAPVSYLDDISTKNLLIHKGRVSGVIDIDEVGFGDPMTFIALTRTALLSMSCDDDICGYLLDAMGASEKQRTAETFYSLMYCADLMSERGMTFNGRKVEVSAEVIDRFNSIYKSFAERWEERKKTL